jgi:hypothetical protein
MTLPSEHDEQVAVCRYLLLRGIPYFAVPNGGHRDKATAARLKAEGVQRGVPDLLVFLPDGRTLALEMKARESGRLSTEQQQWLEYLAGRPGWTTAVVHGAKEAIDLLRATP